MLMGGYAVLLTCGSTTAQGPQGPLFPVSQGRKDIGITEVGHTCHSRSLGRTSPVTSFRCKCSWDMKLLSQRAPLSDDITLQKRDEFIVDEPVSLPHSPEVRKAKTLPRTYHSCVHEYPFSAKQNRVLSLLCPHLS